MYRIPKMRELEEALGLEGKVQHYDAIDPDALEKSKDYRVEVLSSFIDRQPGTYARKTLGERVGVTGRTVRRYDEPGGWQVEEQHREEPLTPEHVKLLPEKREVAPGTVWLEDNEGNKYAYSMRGLSKALDAGKNMESLFRVEQLANHYSPAPQPDRGATGDGPENLPDQHTSTTPGWYPRATNETTTESAE